ncbi:MAG: GNAT family N-acetyltransferase [Caldilineaceae bacterium]|nr:GNAT family N-acetyltransferase [Caldilineaceae bacterium]
MLRELHEGDRKPAYSLLLQAPAKNLYLLGNMETLGFGHEFCQFWGDFGGPPARPLRAVLNRYMSGWSVYGEVEADWAALGKQMESHPVTATRLQDNPGGVPSLLPYLTKYRTEHLFIEQLMELEPAHFAPVKPPTEVVVRRATRDDLPALVALYADAGSLSRSQAAIERPLADTRIWLAEAAGQTVAAALTNAETQAFAMIGGVYTQPNWRGRGVAKAVCSALCAQLLGEGRQPVLYWQTPAAGVVYGRLGFRAVGEWRSVWLQKLPEDELAG